MRLLLNQKINKVSDCEQNFETTFFDSKNFGASMTQDVSRAARVPDQVFENILNKLINYGFPKEAKSIVIPVVEASLIECSELDEGFKFIVLDMDNMTFIGQVFNRDDCFFCSNTNDIREAQHFTFLDDEVIKLVQKNSNLITFRVNEYLLSARKLS